MENNNFHIANITSKEEEAIKQAEIQLKNETGKDFVIIAWEKNNA